MGAHAAALLSRARSTRSGVEAAGDFGGVSGRRASGRTPDVGRRRGECHDGERARRAAGGGVLHPGLLVLHRVPRGPPPRAAEHPQGPARRCAGGAGPGAARHHRARPLLPRRRPHRRRPQSHHGQPDRPARPGEGAPGRRPHGGRLRRHRRTRPRHGQALPGRTRPLREDRGRRHDPRRQGAPPGRHDPAEPRPGHAGPRRRPLLVGYDPARTAGERGRIFSFDIAGGLYEKAGFHAEGSGSPYARGALKKLFRTGLDRREAALTALQALYDAADDDSATGGPDISRQIFPIVSVITEDGFERLPETETAALSREMVEQRRSRPDGPNATP